MRYAHRGLTGPRFPSQRSESPASPHKAEVCKEPCTGSIRKTRRRSSLCSQKKRSTAVRQLALGPRLAGLNRQTQIALGNTNLSPASEALSSNLIKLASVCAHPVSWERLGIECAMAIGIVARWQHVASKGFQRPQAEQACSMQLEGNPSCKCRVLLRSLEAPHCQAKSPSGTCKS